MGRRRQGALYVGDGFPFSEDQIKFIAEYGQINEADVRFIIGLVLMAQRAENQMKREDDEWAARVGLASPQAESEATS